MKRKAKTPKVERCYVELGKAVRELRLIREWNQEKLAKRTRMSRGSIANIELGRQRVLLHDIFRLADALNVVPQSLFYKSMKGRYLK